MSTSIFTKTLDQVIAVAAANTNITSKRAFQGYKRFSDTENFEQMISQLQPYTQGYFFAELGPVAQKYMYDTTFLIRGSLHIYCPKDASNNMDSMWDLAYNLAAAFKLPSNFIDANSNMALPGQIKYSPYEIDVTRTPGIMVMDFGKFGGGGMEFTINS